MQVGAGSWRLLWDGEGLRVGVAKLQKREVPGSSTIKISKTRAMPLTAVPKHGVGAYFVPR